MQRARDPSASRGARWVEELRRRGFDAGALPLIAIVPVPQPQALQDAWGQLDRYRAVMFVSGNAVRHFFAHRPATSLLAEPYPCLGARNRDRAMRWSRPV